MPIHWYANSLNTVEMTKTSIPDSCVFILTYTESQYVNMHNDYYCFISGPLYCLFCHSSTFHIRIWDGSEQSFQGRQRGQPQDSTCTLSWPHHSACLPLSLSKNHISVLSGLREVCLVTTQNTVQSWTPGTLNFFTVNENVFSLYHP